jgi:hypothetical protein
MISDVLSDAVAQIKDYQEHPGTKDCYTGIEAEIANVLFVMDSLRMILDLPPMGDPNIAKPVGNVMACLRHLDLKALKSAREALDKAIQAKANGK